MPGTLIYLSNCAISADGRQNPFMMPELPWLMAHFDRVMMVSYYGVRTLMDKYAGHHNGSLGQFGWTGGSGTWAESDPSEGVSIVYMHNLQPNLEEYHHLRMRATAYGCLE